MTTVPGEVTIDPNLPTAQPRSAIPWDDVGTGWYVLLYDPSQANPTGPGDVREGPRVLYLVDDSGALFEITSWEPGVYAHLVDATPSAALIVRTGSDPDERVYEHVDLASGTKSAVHIVGFSETQHIDAWLLASLTRPSGKNVIVHRAGPPSEWLERRSRDGTVLSIVHERSLAREQTDLSWLYGPDGTFLVVSDNDTLQLVAIDGTSMGDLWLPPDTECRPIRWWDADTLLTRCHQTNPDTAMVDEYGGPHLYYGWMWLIPTDGSAGTALTSIPTEPTTVVDFGFQDAWPAGNETLLQWNGDCGAAGVKTLNADGTGDWVEVDWPEELTHFSSTLLDVRGEVVTLFAWEGCGGDVGMLVTTGLDGDNLQTLVPIIGDAAGVAGVVSLTTIYP